MKLSVVVPCYNEEEVLPETVKALLALLENLRAKQLIEAESRIYFVDDGSRDDTWRLIEQYHQEHPAIHGIKLSRNRGHQNALLAGLFTAEGEVLVSIDADLQDDVSVIESMLLEHQKGSEIVYGVRKERDSDTFFKRFSAEMFYKVMRILGAETVYNHADFRLMGRRSIEALKQFGEVNLFLRGLVPLIGYPSSCVYYDRKERFAGESKYPLKKMLSFAWNGITSLSSLPLRFISVLGFLVFFFSLMISVWALGVKLFTDDAIPGWTSTVLPIYVISGVQLLAIGVIGEYVGKMYLEIKQRPRYLIEKVL